MNMHKVDDKPLILSCTLINALFSVKLSVLLLHTKNILYKYH